ncbi:sensor domain-containing diguanylate cyclase [Thioalkalivibrio thiocyanoxidans]|uniref:sensor domain-containing diguanylate cyclase n=1 Tax=Thioalkalivibrio thiocyanoxidans TaxID=152475 RepID=UPI0003695B6A|nr:diguanylate cyclase [Thioalkalivibrio thiocyanoxidans]
MALEDQDHFNALIVDNAAVWINSLDVEGRITFWNRAAERISGYSREEVLGHAMIWEWLYPDPYYREAVFARARQMMQQGEGLQGFETTIRTRSGDERTLEWHSEQLFDANGRLLGASSVAHDITARRRLEAAHDRQHRLQRLIAEISAELINITADRIDTVVEESLARLGMFFALGRAYVFRFDVRAGQMSLVSEWCADDVQAYRDHLQAIPLETHSWVTSQVLAGKVVHIPDVDQLPPEAKVEQAEFRREHIRSLLLIPLISDQKAFGMVGYDAVEQPYRWAEEQITALRLVADMIAGTLARKQVEQELARQARIDGLTGLANRRELDDLLERECAARRERSLSLLMIDIDHFKPYNDAFGHQAGDDCLRAVADAIRSVLNRPSDLGARYGGEEFACVLADTDPEGGLQVAERIREAVSALELKHPESAEPHVTISIGICSVHTRWPIEPRALIRQADEALYHAKRAGRNRVEAQTLRR